MFCHRLHHTNNEDKLATNSCTQHELIEAVFYNWSKKFRPSQNLFLSLDCLSSFWWTKERDVISFTYIQTISFIYGIYVFMINSPFSIFFIEKPTLTTVKKSRFEPQLFPEILICSEPSFDLDEINALGYSDSWNYFRGLVRRG